MSFFQKTFDSIKSLFSFEPVEIATDAEIVDETKSVDTIIDNVSEHEQEIETQTEPELVRQTLFDETPYIFMNKKTHEHYTFHYLNDNKLNKLFGFCSDSNIYVYKVHFCMFAVNGSCRNIDGTPIPFLQFLMDSNTKSFPMTKFSCSLDNLENVDVYFKNECLKKCLEYFAIEENITPEILEIMKTINNGFLEINDNDIVVVFDLSDFLKLPLRYSKSPLWIGVNEIEQMDHFTKYVFAKYKYLKTLKTSENDVVEPPRILYLYNVVNGTYIEKTQQDAVTIVDNRTLHPVYGNFHYFIEVPPEASSELYLKYSVFEENVIDLTNKNDLGENTDEELNKDLEKDLGENGEEELEKDLNEADLGENTEENDLGENTEENDLGESEEEELEKDLEKDLGENTDEELEKDLDEADLGENEQIDYPFNSVIIFKENDKKIWCVKLDSLFTPLNM